MAKRGNPNFIKGKILKDFTGQEYGVLKVIGFHSLVKSRTKWNCQCVCGEIRVLGAGELVKADTSQCRCNAIKRKNRPLHLRNPYIVPEIFFKRIEYAAGLKGLGYDFTLEKIQGLYEKQNRCCALSGVPIEFKPMYHNGGTASLDRIDSSRGYFMDNVQWVHKRVNWMKQAMTDREFIQWCRLIVEHNK